MPRVPRHGGSIETVTFDDDARREFLTGFHKRKLQRTTERRNRAIERDKLKRREIRAEARKQRAEQAHSNAAQVENAYGGTREERATESDGSAGSDHEREEAFDGVEQLATVTIVEDFNPEDTLHPPQRLKQSSLPTASPDVTVASVESKAKPRSKKIPYESRASLKAQRLKERKRKFEKRGVR